MLVELRQDALRAFARQVQSRTSALPVEATPSFAALVDLAGPVAAEIGWRSGFDTMIAHATRKGWVDEAGGVRIHVEQR